MKHPPFHIVGTRELCAWQVAPGVCWVQSRNPKFAHALRNRRDAHQVAWGSVGGYLAIFEVKKSLSWARKFIDRQTSKQGAAGKAINRDSLTAQPTKSQERVTVAQEVAT